MRINPISLSSETQGRSEPRPDIGQSPKERKQAEPAQKDSQNSQAVRLSELKTALAEHDISLNYSHDEETNRVVIKLVNHRTGEAIRQIPTEVSLKLSAQIQGQFLDQKI